MAKAPPPPLATLLQIANLANTTRHDLARREEVKDQNKNAA